MMTRLLLALAAIQTFEDSARDLDVRGTEVLARGVDGRGWNVLSPE